MRKYFIPLAILIAGVFIAGAIFLTQKPISPQPTFEESDDTQKEINIEFAGWSAMGEPNAPVVMVEYSDFACPFCARFWQETLPSIKRDYIDTSKMRFVYKDFIVVGGDRAAEAAHCAAEQGKFCEYHDILYARQTQDRPRWLDPKIHQEYARELGLDEAALAECFEERHYQEKVILSSREAMQNGGTGTPFFLINEQPIVGAQSFEVFQALIEEKFRRAK